jgi:2'-5' RNA ligase
MRLFVAVELDDEVRKALAALQESFGPAGRDVRWVKHDLMHLTLKFLGDADDLTVVEVARVVERVAADTRGFALEVGSTGCFPPRGEVRIVWAGAAEGSGGLVGCVERLEAGLAELGFAPEGRAYSPHITIGRVREDHSRGRLREAVTAARFEPLLQEVSEMVVMSSELSRTGPTYTVVSRAAFGRL